jgi:hypothetical protein
MEPSPADDRAAEAHERLVDVVPAVEPRPQSVELVEQGERLLDHVAEDPQPAAMRRVATGDGRGDPVARVFAERSPTVHATISFESASMAVHVHTSP